MDASNLVVFAAIDWGSLVTAIIEFVNMGRGLLQHFLWLSMPNIIKRVRMYIILQHLPINKISKIQQHMKFIGEEMVGFPGAGGTT